jgi:hypothetical protein
VGYGEVTCVILIVKLSSCPQITSTNVHWRSGLFQEKLSRLPIGCSFSLLRFINKRGHLTYGLKCKGDNE